MKCRSLQFLRFLQHASPATKNAQNALSFVAETGGENDETEESVHVEEDPPAIVPSPAGTTEFKSTKDQRNDANITRQVLKRVSNRWEHAEDIEDADRMEIVLLGGPMSIVEAMGRHNNDADIVTHGCRALGNLSVAGTEAERVVAKVGGIAAVVKALSQFPEHEGLQECGCEALKKLVSGSQENGKVLAFEKGIQAVVTAMKKHPGIAKIQRDGCIVLEKLASVSEDVNDQIVKEGGLSAASNAAEAHPDNLAVRIHAARALERIGKTIRRHSVTAELSSISEASGVMKRFSSKKTIGTCNKKASAHNSNTQKYGCGAIWEVLEDESKNNISSAILQKDEISTEIAVAPMEPHTVKSANSILPEYYASCGALYGLKLAGNDAKPDIVKDGGLSAMTKVAKKNIDISRIQGSTGSALVADS